MSLRKEHPVALVSRMLMLDKLNSIGADLIGRLSPEVYGKFLKRVAYPQRTESVATYQEKMEINWEYAIFEAQDIDFEKLFDNFVRKKVDPEKAKEVSKLLKKNEPVIKLSRNEED